MPTKKTICILLKFFKFMYVFLYVFKRLIFKKSFPNCKIPTMTNKIQNFLLPFLVATLISHYIWTTFDEHFLLINDTSETSTILISDNLLISEHIYLDTWLLLGQIIDAMTWKFTRFLLKFEEVEFIFERLIYSLF